MSRLISYVLANRQSARKRVVIAVRFERDADIDLISVQDRDEQCVAIPCAAKTILILGGARALPTPPPANGLGEPPPRRLPHSSGRCSHYEPPDHLALCRSASSNVLHGYAAYKEAVCLPACRLPSAGGAALAGACQLDRERHVGDRYLHREWQEPGVVGNPEVDRARRIVRVAILAGLAFEAGDWRQG